MVLCYCNPSKLTHLYKKGHILLIFCKNVSKKKYIYTHTYVYVYIYVPGFLVVGLSQSSCRQHSHSSVCPLVLHTKECYKRLSKVHLKLVVLTLLSPRILSLFAGDLLFTLQRQKMTETWHSQKVFCCVRVSGCLSRDLTLGINTSLIHQHLLSR